MSRTFVQPGHTIDVIAGNGGVTVGVPLMLGALLIIPEVSALEGEIFAASVVGVHRLPKAAGALEPGAIAYFDNSAHAVGATGAGLYPVGVVIEHAGSSDTTALVKLNGVAATAVAGP